VIHDALATQDLKRNVQNQEAIHEKISRALPNWTAVKEFGRKSGGPASVSERPTG